MSDFSILWTVLGIGLLIFIHELGHYLAARLARVRVEIFSLGFGPRLFGFRLGPTDYRLSAVPLGGYVKVAGDDPTERHFLEPDDLHSKGFFARALFFSGGVLMNFVFALIVFPLVFRSGVEFTAPVLGEVAAGGAAWEADLRPGDRIRAVDGKRMYSWDNMSTEIALAGGSEVELEIDRDGKTIERTVRPRYSPALGAYAIEVLPALEPAPPKLVVDRGSKAWERGLRDGDLLVSFDGHAVDVATLENDFARLARDPTREVPIVVSRDGQPISASIQPELRPIEQPRIGISPPLRRIRGIKAPAAGAFDLRIGDRIVAVDLQPFLGTSLRAFEEGPSGLSITIEREGRRDPIEFTKSVTPDERRALLRSIAVTSDDQTSVIVTSPGLPADRAGLQSGDEIREIDGAKVGAWKDLQKRVTESDGRKLTVTYARAGATATVDIVPTREQLTFGIVPRITYAREVYRVPQLLPAIGAGFVCSIDLVKQIYVTLKRLFTGEVAAKNLGGIIQISVVTHEFAKSGWARFLYFLGLLSINLAFMNFLPIPVLDGGHMLFLVIERLKGSPVSARTLGYAQMAGLVFLIALMLFVTFNDIRRHF